MVKDSVFSAGATVSVVTDDGRREEQKCTSISTKYIFFGVLHPTNTTVAFRPEGDTREYLMLYYI